MATTQKTAKPAKAAASKSSAAKAAPAPQAAEASVAASAPVRREIVGVVVSNKMQKTITVKVDRRVRHSLYAKYVTRTRRFKAHDEKNEAKIGDQVVLVESRPMSRDKRWALQSVLRRAVQTVEANV